MSEPITFVITSCCRFDLLEKTIQSFIDSNTYPIERFLMIEDGEDNEIHEKIRNKYGDQFDIIIEEHRGHLSSVDRVYQEVTTDLIFHCQDDWEFSKGNFVEESVEIMKENSDVGLVWIRIDDNPHPLQDKVHLTSSGHEFKYVVEGWRYGEDGIYNEDWWHGFSFNPGLRRLSDYQKIAPLAPYKVERQVNLAFHRLGLKVVALTTNYVQHIGWERGLKP